MTEAQGTAVIDQLGSLLVQVENLVFLSYAAGFGIGVIAGGLACAFLISVGRRRSIL
jgi:hypothetical protein